MMVDMDPFPSATVSMVDAHLPKENGRLILPQILKKGSQPRLKINLFSNAPPTKLSVPAIVESMSDSSEDGNGGPIMPTSQPQSTITTKLSKEPSEG
ncbi:hypothetical protein ACFX1Q_040437 [Malus domestica]